MGSPGDERERLEKALAAAYRSRGGPEANEAWEARVMNGIRSISEEVEGASWMDIFGGLFWKVCPVACACVIFLAVAVYRYNVVVEQDIAQMLADDPVEMVILDPDNV